MRISDWSSDVCSSDLLGRVSGAIDWRVGRREPSAGFAGLSASQGGTGVEAVRSGFVPRIRIGEWQKKAFLQCAILSHPRSEEHTSELQSLMRISYAVFCLKKKKKQEQERHENRHSNLQT